MSDSTPTVDHRSASPKSQDHESLRYWLALAFAPGVGAKTFTDLLAVFPDPKELFELPIALLAKRIKLSDKLRNYLRNPPWERIDPVLAWLEADPSHHICTLADADYPQCLAQISDPPPLLYVVGDAAVLRYPQLAMVGSRNASRSGVDTATEFARHLSNAGLIITSGLATGIDAASHEGALAGSGLTVAVTGTGLDRVYPARHRDLAHRIAQQGVLVSEYPPGTPAIAHNFPRRNRIISGLSLGTLVVEAAQQSGSLITARLAMEQGREVFAIPGSIHNPLARGCHRLIRQGAKLVETAQDILEELGPQIGSALPVFQHDAQRLSKDVDTQTAAVTLPANQQHQMLLDQLGYEPADIDTLVERCQLTPEVISSMLVELELVGHVYSHGGRYSRNVVKEG